MQGGPHVWEFQELWSKLKTTRPSSCRTVDHIFLPMAAKFTFEVEKFLECPICIEECKDPRVLPCLHSLCKTCMQTYVKQFAKNNKFNCPACRHSCQLPAGGVDALPKNFILNSLKEVLRHSPGEAASGPRKLERVCSNHNKGDLQHTTPTVFCADCAEFYCSNCESFHKMFGATSEHRLRPAGEIGQVDVSAAESKKRRPKCDKHPNQSLDIYCDSCKIPVCPSCCHLTHRQHDHRDLNEVAEEAKTNLDHFKGKADQIEKRLTEHLQKLDTSERQINKDGNEVCQEINRGADELIAIITKQKQSLIQKVKTSQQAAVAEVRAAGKETELNIVAAQSFKSYIETLETSGDVIDQVTHTPGLQEQLRQLDSVPQQSISWNVSLKKESQSLTALGAMLGTVSVEKKVVASGVVDDSTKHVLGDPVLCMKPDLSNCETLSGLAVIGDCVYVTGWREQHLWIHNIQTGTNKLHTITDLAAVGMTTVHDKTNNNNNTLVITDNNKKIHFVTISPQNMNITKHTVKDIPFTPRHVNVHSSTGKLIIANYSDKQIVVCDSTGNIENKVTVKTSIGEMKCVLATDDGYIVVDDSMQGRVHWVAKEGDVIHTYGERDNESLRYPHHASIDRQGLLVVADFNNHRVHLIDANRRLSHYLLTEKDDFRYPCGVCLDAATQRLFVGHWDQHNAVTVSVYTWPYRSTPGTHHKLQVKLKSYK